MKKETVINKAHCKGLYGKLLERIYNLNTNPKIKRRGEYLSLRSVRAKLGPGFCLKKQEIMEILFFLRDLSLVEIVPNGLKINFKMVENAK